MSLGVVNQDGELLGHRNMPAGPAPLLNAVAPSRTDLVVCVAGLFPWDWLADLGARAGLPCVLGHALSRKALHGGTAQNDTIAAHNIAVRLRGGLLPQASVSPAARRATRDRRRRRRPRRRKRAALVTPVQHTNRQDHWPEIGTTIASKTHRPGGAERCAAPAVHQSGTADRALRDSEDPRLRDLAVALVTMAQQHEAHTLSVLQTVPGIGQILSLVLLYARPDLARCPRGQDVGASGRLGTCAKAAAGTREGTSGTQSGNASLPGAFADAAVMCLRNHPASPTSLARCETPHGQGKAWTVWAPKRARAVADLVTRRVVFDRDTLLQSSGRGAGEPAASRGHAGRRLATVLCHEAPRASTNAQEPRGPVPCPGACAWTPARAPGPRANGPAGDRVLPLPRT